MANFYSAAKKVKKIRKRQQVIIESLDQSLTGVTHIDNKVIFVPGALPAEQVDIQITDEQKKYAKAQLIEVIESSIERIAPHCSHFNECGGCQVQHLSGEQQLSYKEASLKNRFNSSVKEVRWFDAITSSPWHYRRRARIGVNVEKNKALRVGFRKKASNEIVDIHRCDVLAKPFDNIFDPLRKLIDVLNARESIGHVEVIDTPDHKVALFRITSKLINDDMITLASFAQAHQLTVLLETNDGQVHPLPDNHLPMLRYPLFDAEIGFTPGNFIQVNSAVNEKMVARAVEWLDILPSDKVLDLFCGVGNFSLALAKKAALVVGVEGVKEMAQQAQDNAKAAGVDNTAFFHCNLSQPLSEQQWFDSKLRKKVDKMLLDPARDGALEICRQLSQLKPSKIVYVSCEPASLERDTREIIKQGYRLEKLCVMDMFPQTRHLESMALFVKSTKKPKAVKKRLI